MESKAIMVQEKEYIRGYTFLNETKKVFTKQEVWTYYVESTGGTVYLEYHHVFDRLKRYQYGF